MSKRKSNKAKLAEGRCQGIGAEYVPFYKANEGGGRATCSMIPDPIEGRMVHCLSDTESMLYYLLRWNTDVVHIREQYLLDHELVNKVRAELGYSKVSPMACYTTDFLVDFDDDRQVAYSVKYRKSDFLPTSRVYRGRQRAYIDLIERQNTERAYWEALGVPFHVVTRDDLMEHRIFIKNVAFVQGFWDEMNVCNTDQMLLYLICHHIIEVPMDEEFINPRKLVQSMGFDVQALFEKTINMRKKLMT